MLVPRIVHKNLSPSEALDGFVEDQVRTLERLEPRLQTCQVILKAVHGHLRNGRSFDVQIDLGLPGRHIAAGVRRDRVHRYTDIYEAVVQSFDNARRQVREARLWLRAAHRRAKCQEQQIW